MNKQIFESPKNQNELTKNFDAFAFQPREVKEKTFLNKTTIGDYKLGSVLGKGGCGIVKKAKHTSDSKMAMKIVDLKTFDEERRLRKTKKLFLEVEFMSLVGSHPNILGVKDFMYHGDKYFIATDIAECDLFDYVMQQGSLKEDEAKRLFNQLLSAVSFMHKNGVAHRDLKPENVLMKDGSINICDFGLSAYWEEGDESLTEPVGTLRCVPPEMIVYNSNEKIHYKPFEVDVWCCGIILFFMLTGEFPFEAENNNQTLKNTKKRQYSRSFPSHFSPEVKDFLNFLFLSEQRPTLSQLFQHPFLATNN